MICNNCGKKVRQDAGKCKHCGARLASVPLHSDERKESQEAYNNIYDDKLNEEVNDLLLSKDIVHKENNDQEGNTPVNIDKRFNIKCLMGFGISILSMPCGLFAVVSVVSGVLCFLGLKEISQTKEDGHIFGVIGLCISGFVVVINIIIVLIMTVLAYVA